MNKTIIHVSYDFFPRPFWGVAQHVLDIASGLSGDGVRVFIVTRSSGLIPESKRDANLSVINSSESADSLLITNKFMENETYTDFDLLMAWNVHIARKTIMELDNQGRRPVAIHNHGWMTWKASRMIAEHFSAQIISSYHFLEKQYSGTGYNPSLVDHENIVNIERESVLLSNEIIVFSEVARDMLMGIYPNIDKSKIELIPHGIDLEEIDKYKQRHEKSRKDGQPIRVLFVGRLVKEKGIDVLLRVAKQLSEKNNIEFNIAGGGNDLERLRHEYGSEKIKFLGHLSKDILFKYYGEADILCHPSLTETFGLSIAEAMAFGIPVVTTKGPTMPDHVKDMETGLLIDLKYTADGTLFSETDLANSLLKLAKDSQLRSRFSGNCLNFAKTNLDQKSMIRKTIDVYEKTTQIRIHS